MPDAPFDAPSTSIDDGEVIRIPWKDSILDTIRERPAMYLGEATITALWHFLIGWNMALDRVSGYAEKPREVPNDSADWVGYRLHLDSNRGGFWKQAILSRVRDQQRALDRFFELRDEYLCREPKLVATIRKDRREYQQKRASPHAGLSSILSSCCQNRSALSCTRTIPASSLKLRKAKLVPTREGSILRCPILSGDPGPLPTDSRLVIIPHGTAYLLRTNGTDVI